MDMLNLWGRNMHITHTHTHTHTHIYIYMYIHMYLHIHIHNTYIYTYIHTHTYTHNTYIHICIYIYTNIHTLTNYIYIYLEVSPIMLLFSLELMPTSSILLIGFCIHCLIDSWTLYRTTNNFSWVISGVTDEDNSFRYHTETQYLVYRHVLICSTFNQVAADCVPCALASCRRLLL